jgi:hypothetical protein
MPKQNHSQDIVDSPPGKGSIHSFRLCNFARGSSEPLSSHKTYIQGDLAKLTSNFGTTWVQLTGYASALGDADRNRSLSEARLQKVRLEILKINSAANFILGQGVGEDESGSDQQDDSGYYRAVKIACFRSKPNVDPPPPPPENRPSLPHLPSKFHRSCVPGAECPLSSSFSIQVTRGVVIGEAILAGAYQFKIKDETNHLISIYEARGLGAGVSKLPFNMSYGAKPNNFVTSTPIKVTQFGRTIRLFGWQILTDSGTKAVLNYPDGAVIIEEFDTGGSVLDTALSWMTLELNCVTRCSLFSGKSALYEA